MSKNIKNSCRSFSEWFNNNKKLNEREKLALQKRANGETMKQIGETLGISGSSASQCLSKANFKLIIEFRKAFGLYFDTYHFGEDLNSAKFEEDELAYTYNTYNLPKTFFLDEKIINASSMIYIVNKYKKGIINPALAMSDPRVPEDLKEKISELSSIELKPGKKTAERNVINGDGTFLETFARVCCSEPSSLEEMVWKFNYFIEKLILDGFPKYKKYIIPDFLAGEQRTNQIRNTFFCESVFIKNANDQYRYYNYFDICFLPLEKAIKEEDAEEKLTFSFYEFYINHPQLMRAYDFRDYCELKYYLAYILKDSAFWHDLAFKKIFESKTHYHYDTFWKDNFAEKNFIKESELKKSVYERYRFSKKQIDGLLTHYGNRIVKDKGRSIPWETMDRNGNGEEAPDSDILAQTFAIARIGNTPVSIVSFIELYQSFISLKYKTGSAGYYKNSLVATKKVLANFLLCVEMSGKIVINSENLIRCYDFTKERFDLFYNKIKLKKYTSSTGVFCSSEIFRDNLELMSRLDLRDFSELSSFIMFSAGMTEYKDKLHSYGCHSFRLGRSYWFTQTSGSCQYYNSRPIDSECLWRNTSGYIHSECKVQYDAKSKRWENTFSKIPAIGNVEVVPKERDVNKGYEKDDGYLLSMYFEINAINQSCFKSNSPVIKGVICGGSIEIYRNADDAKNRNEYLSCFDGTSLGSYHFVNGNLVIRLSRNLSETQSKKIAAEICLNYETIDGETVTVSEVEYLD